jgi:hypothetical protein
MRFYSDSTASFIRDIKSRFGAKSMTFEQLPPTTSAAMATLTEKPGMSILDVLPTEVIAMICSLLQKGEPPDGVKSQANALPRNALCNLRLASKNCAAAAESYLFRNLHILYTKRSFQNLLNISRSAHLAKHVRSLCYEPRILPKDFLIGGFAAYYEAEMIEGPGTKPVLSMEQSYKAYQELSNEQEHIISSAWDLAIFTSSIARFPCLDTIAVDTESVPSYRAQQLVPPAYHCTDSLYESPYEPDSRRRHRAITKAILVATALSTANLVKLHISLVDEQLLCSLYGAENVIVPTFKHLRHLTMTLYRYRDHGSSKGLRDLLQFAPVLESLTIKFSYNNEFRQPRRSAPIVWDNAVAGLFFPKLQRLSLSGLPVHPSSLTKFLVRHAKTLRGLILHSMYLLPDPMGWHNIIEVLRNDLSLEVVGISGTWGGAPKDGEGRRYLVRLDRNIDGCPAYKYVENRVLKKAPSLMEQFPSIKDLCAAIVQGDPNHSHANVNVGGGDVGEDEESFTNDEDSQFCSSDEEGFSNEDDSELDSEDSSDGSSDESQSGDW